jgi:NTP pyrophosphatase (non-canonical NTP hydrolase)
MNLDRFPDPPDPDLSEPEPSRGYGTPTTFAELVEWQTKISTIRSGPIMATKANMATYFAALMVEAGECLNLLNWKPWKRHHAVDTDRILDEFADMQAFLYLIADLICQATGVQPEDLLAAYIQKSQINRDRLNGLIPGYEKEDD